MLYLGVVCNPDLFHGNSGEVLVKAYRRSGMRRLHALGLAVVAAVTGLRGIAIEQEPAPSSMFAIRPARNGKPSWAWRQSPKLRPPGSCGRSDTRRTRTIFFRTCRWQACLRNCEEGRNLPVGEAMSPTYDCSAIPNTRRKPAIGTGATTSFTARASATDCV